MTEYDILFNDSITNRENMPFLIDWLIDNNREIEADCWKFIYFYNKIPTHVTTGRVWVYNDEDYKNHTAALPEWLFIRCEKLYDLNHTTLIDAYIRLINAWLTSPEEKRKRIVEGMYEMQVW